MNASRLTYRPIELARLSGLSERTVRRAIKDGALPATRRGRAVLVPAEAAERWLQGSPPIAAASEPLRAEARRLLERLA